ncbi:MAG: sugar phosphate isomerase/epimerase family protein [Kiritimatiellia bacterium]|jgi:sugar phosphate isomerase/epimerase|nr:sugar phosphate isomerase/epimerase family protein [Kiritimatiellia bacterium]
MRMSAPLLLIGFLFPLYLGCAVLTASEGDGGSGSNPFFAFDNGVGRGRWAPKEQVKVLKDIGYAGIGYTGTQNLPDRLKVFKSRGLTVFSLYVHCRVGSQTPYPLQLEEAVKQLEGTQTMLWLTVQGKPDDEEAARVVGEIADLAAKRSVKVALYPHHGFFVATARDAVRIVKRADRKNLGVSINLCHELRSGNAKDLDDIIKEAAPYLYLVSINGADLEGNWDRLIQPLGQGAFDMRAFLGKLKATGYRGPIGLQCYNIRGDQKENLEASMKSWRELCSPVESEKDEALNKE